jgi:hypothetical protein
VLVAWAGAIAAAINAGVIASTFLPRPPHLPPPVTTISWVVSIPILAAAVFLVRDGGTDGLWRSGTGRKQLHTQLLCAVPLPGRVIAAVVAGVGWLIALATMLSGALTGAPEVVDGRYALNNHGTITFITEAEYGQALLRENRISSGIAMALQAGAAALAVGAARRARP